MSDTAVIVNIVILVILIAWSLFDELIKEKIHKNNTSTPSQRNALIEDKALKTKVKPLSSCFIWVKALIVIQVLTLVFGILHYFKS